MNDSLYLSHSDTYGLLVSSNAPSKFYKQMIKEWFDNGAKELRFNFEGREIVLVPKKPNRPPKDYRPKNKSGHL